MATFREFHALVTCKTFRLFFRLSRIILGCIKKNTSNNTICLYACKYAALFDWSISLNS